MRDRQFTTTWIKGLLILAMGMQLCACGKDAAKDPAEAPQTGGAGTPETTEGAAPADVTDGTGLSAQEAEEPEDPAKAAEREAVHAALKELGTFYDAFWSLTDAVAPGYQYKAPDHKWDETPWESHREKFRAACPDVKESDVVGKYYFTSQTIEGSTTDFSYLKDMGDQSNSVLWLEEGTVGELNRFGAKTVVRWNMDGWINLGLPDSVYWELHGEELKIIYSDTTYDIYTRVTPAADEKPPVVEIAGKQKEKGKKLEGRVYRLVRKVDPEPGEYTDGYPGYEECDPFGTSLENADDNFVVFTDNGYGYRRINGEDYIFYYREDRDYWEAGGNAFFRGAENYAYDKEGVTRGETCHYEIRGTTLRVYRNEIYIDNRDEPLKDYWDITLYEMWDEYELSDEEVPVSHNPDIGPIDSWEEMVIPQGTYEDAGLWQIADFQYKYDFETTNVYDYNVVKSHDWIFPDQPHTEAGFYTGDELRRKGKDFYLEMLDGGRGWVHVFGKNFPITWSSEGIYGYDLTGRFPIWDGHKAEGLEEYSVPARITFGIDNMMHCSRSDKPLDIPAELQPFFDAEARKLDYVSVGDGDSWFGKQGLSLTQDKNFAFSTSLYEGGKESGTAVLGAYLNTSEGDAAQNELARDGYKHITMYAIIECEDLKEDMYINCVPFDRYTGVSMAQKGGEVFHCSVKDPMITEPDGFHAEIYNKTIEIDGKPTEIEIVKSWGWTDYTDYDYETGESIYHERVFSISYSIDCPKDYYGTLFQFSGSTKEQADANTKMDYAGNSATTLDVTPYFSRECVYAEPAIHAAAEQ